MPEAFSCDLRNSLTNIQHLSKRGCYKITLEVPTEIGSRIMEFAAMLGGLRPWDESKHLDGGLVLTQRESTLGEVVVSDDSTGWTLRKSENSPHLLALCDQYGKLACWLSPANASFYEKVTEALEDLRIAEVAEHACEGCGDEAIRLGKQLIETAERVKARKTKQD